MIHLTVDTYWPRTFTVTQSHVTLLLIHSLGLIHLLIYAFCLTRYATLRRCRFPAFHTRCSTAFVRLLLHLLFVPLLIVYGAIYVTLLRSTTLTLPLRCWWLSGTAFDLRLPHTCRSTCVHTAFPFVAWIRVHRSPRGCTFTLDLPDLVVTCVRLPSFVHTPHRYCFLLLFTTHVITTFPFPPRFPRSRFIYHTGYHWMRIRSHLVYVVRTVTFALLRSFDFVGFGCGILVVTTFPTCVGPHHHGTTAHTTRSLPFYAATATTPLPHPLLPTLRSHRYRTLFTLRDVTLHHTRLRVTVTHSLRCYVVLAFIPHHLPTDFLPASYHTYTPHNISTLIPHLVVPLPTPVLLCCYIAGEHVGLFITTHYLFIRITLHGPVAVPISTFPTTFCVDLLFPLHRYSARCLLPFTFYVYVSRSHYDFVWNTAVECLPRSRADRSNVCSHAPLPTRSGDFDSRLLITAFSLRLRLDTTFPTVFTGSLRSPFHTRAASPTHTTARYVDAFVVVPG